MQSGKTTNNKVPLPHEDPKPLSWVTEIYERYDKGVDNKWQSLKFERELFSVFDRCLRSFTSEIPEHKPPTKDNFLYKPFYDEHEPDWLSKFCGITRMGIYEAVIFKGLTYNDYKAQCSFYSNFKGTAVLIGGKLVITAYFILCRPIDRLFLALSLLTDLGILASTIKIYSNIAFVESEQKAICADYQDKSMECIFKEAYEKKYISLKIPELELSR